MQDTKKAPLLCENQGGFGLTYGSEVVLDAGLNAVAVVVVASDE